MRIISGEHKGRRITAPKKLPVRPTTDRAKEGLFNILQHRLEWSSLQALDLFSGTGNISYELASRGVPGILAVDQNRPCIEFIRNTSRALALPIEAIQADASVFVKRGSQKFDFVFADPPYSFTTDDYLKSVHLIESNLLNAEGLIVVEHSLQIKLEAAPNFNFSKNYGNSVFSFFV